MFEAFAGNKFTKFLAGSLPVSGEPNVNVFVTLQINGRILYYKAL
jgi:hypothetical protein